MALLSESLIAYKLLHALELRPPAGTVITSYNKKGEHGELSCCALCKDIEDHAQASASLLAQFESAMDNGDWERAAELARQLNENVEGQMDAIAKFESQCPDNTSCEELCRQGL